MSGTTVAGGRRWYVTAAYVEERVVQGGSELRPTSTMHAKEVGTLTTACGVWAYAWPKLQHLTFPLAPQKAAGVEMCRACLVRVIGERW